MKWLMDQRKQGYQIFAALDDLPPTDIRRTICMDPMRIRLLLDTQDVTEISRFYHYLDEIIAVRRSPASELGIKRGDKLSLKSMMPKHDVKTVELQV